MCRQATIPNCHDKHRCRVNLRHGGHLTERELRVATLAFSDDGDTSVTSTAPSEQRNVDEISATLTLTAENNDADVDAYAHLSFSPSTVICRADNC